MNGNSWIKQSFDRITLCVLAIICWEPIVEPNPRLHKVNSHLHQFSDLFLCDLTARGLQSHPRNICRRCTCTRKPCRRWSIQYPQPLRTISSPGQLRRLLIATSARVFSGVLHDKVYGVWSAVLNVTRSARTYWMQIVCKVSNINLRICDYISLILMNELWNQ